MKKYLWTIGLVLVGAAIILFFTYLKPKMEMKKMDFTYTTLQKGDIEAVVSNTGTVDPVHKVEVGTQISGTISKIYVDYNDKVHAGQLLAEMDMRLLQTAFQNAEANLAVAETQLDQSLDEYGKSKALYEKSIIAEREYIIAKFAYERALSQKKSAEAAVKTARVNLGYAKITSPIKGTIIKKNVDEGQTVAASFATPTLFVIAEDLSKMQILADVDESDIGEISNEQQVRFTVQAYPEKQFYGKVSQIRLMPVEINNVVNYKVVVAVVNKDGLLLPGMTATLDFVTDRAMGVLLVNNSALRFKPSEAMLKQVKPLLAMRASYLPDSLQKNFLKGLEKEEVYLTEFKKLLPEKMGYVFYKDKGNKLSVEFVHLGITTGKYSEIASVLGPDSLKPDMEIINSIIKK